MEILIDYECYCCFYEYSLNNNIPLYLYNNCLHILCYKCIYKLYLKYNNNYICPLCRRSSSSFNNNNNDNNNNNNIHLYPCKINYNILKLYHSNYKDIKQYYNDNNNNNNNNMIIIFSYNEIKKKLNYNYLKDKLFCFSNYSCNLRNVDVIITTFNSNYGFNNEFDIIIQQFEDEIPRLSQINHENISKYIGFINEDENSNPNDNNSDNEENNNVTIENNNGDMNSLTNDTKDLKEENNININNNNNNNEIPHKFQKAYIIEKYQDTLSNKLFGNQTTPLDSKQRLKIAIGISSALLYLYDLHNHLPFSSNLHPSITLSFFSSHPFVHGNLICDNIQLSIVTNNDTNNEIEYIPKLTNIGIFPMIQNYFKNQSLNIFVNSYLTPEGKYGIYDSKSEIYLFGIILIELLTGRPAISILESIDRSFSLNSNVFLSKFRERYLDTSCEWNDELWQGILMLSKQCLRRSRDERPTIHIIHDTLNNLLNTKIIVPETNTLQKGNEKKIVGKLKMSMTSSTNKKDIKIQPKISKNSPSQNSSHSRHSLPGTTLATSNNSSTTISSSSSLITTTASNSTTRTSRRNIITPTLSSNLTSNSNSTTNIMTNTNTNTNGRQRRISSSNGG